MTIWQVHSCDMVEFDRSIECDQTGEAGSVIWWIFWIVGSVIESCTIFHVLFLFKCHCCGRMACSMFTLKYFVGYNSVRYILNYLVLHSPMCSPDTLKWADLYTIVNPLCQVFAFLCFHLCSGSKHLVPTSELHLCCEWDWPSDIHVLSHWYPTTWDHLDEDWSTSRW